MHVKLIEAIDAKILQENINNEIKRLYSVSPSERNFTYIKDIKYSNTDYTYTALIIYDEK